MDHRTADTSPAGPLQALPQPPVSEPPLRPDLARDLIARAEQASTNWSRRLRNELDDLRLGQVRHTDYANAKVLRRILAEYDWPGHRLVGRDGCRAAWQLALHADDDPDVQRSAARLLHRALQAGDAPAWQWAHLHDRVLISTGQPQEYGTQYTLSPQGVERYPVREAAGLDSRRARVGLPAAADAVATLRQRLASLSSRPGVASGTGRGVQLASAA
ncbi:DUF6624 domain-containing protein [Streptomyces eurythermus]|uniref:DUF6624 domain-containing protein n=1 Tax=Streptomyces eurythermus TaxID=42237 RepID=UPI0036B60836